MDIDVPNDDQNGHRLDQEEEIVPIVLLLRIGYLLHHIIKSLAFDFLLAVSIFDLVQIIEKA